MLREVRDGTDAELCIAPTKEEARHGTRAITRGLSGDVLSGWFMITELTGDKDPCSLREMDHDRHGGLERRRQSKTQAPPWLDCNRVPAGK